MPKVRELIDILSNFDPDAELEFGTDDTEGNVISVLDSAGIKNVIGPRAFMSNQEPEMASAVDEEGAYAEEGEEYYDEPEAEIDYEEEAYEEEAYEDDEEAIDMDVEVDLESEIRHDPNFRKESSESSDSEEEYEVSEKDLDDLSYEELEALSNKIV